MDWLIAHATQTKNFIQDSAFYTEPLYDMLNIKSPLMTVEDCKHAFSEVQTYVRNKKNLTTDREKIVSCFALQISSFLITNLNYKYKLSKQEIYNGLNYNGFYYDIIIKVDNGSSLNKSVVDTVFRLLLARGKFSFNDLYWHLTNIYLTT